MIAQFSIKYITEEERRKVKILQHPQVVLVRLEGDTALVEDITGLLESVYETLH